MENKRPNVGIFFKVLNDFLVDAVDLEKGEPYGEAIQFGGHYDFHVNFVPSTPNERRFKTHDYDYYPRGRVVFFPKKSHFILYTDTCLKPEDLSRITQLFGLGGQTVEVAEDEHYRCSSCNKFYME